MATVSCHYVKAALGGSTRHGHDANELLVRSGINPRLIATATPTGRVSDSQMTRLVQRIWWVMADEFMGFTHSPCKQGLFALIVESVSKCANLREVFDLGGRLYNHYSDDIHTQLVEVENTALLASKFTHPELDPDHFYQEFWLVIWHRFSSWMIGRKIPLLYANLAYPKPTHAAELNHLFPCPINFSYHENQLAFETRYLNLPPIRSKTEIASFLKHSPAGLMTIPGDDRSLKSEITKSILIQNQSVLSLPNIQQIANRFHLTPQTLHRSLKREGTSYQRIKDSIRRDIAVTRLVKDRMKVKQVAVLVGFSESRSFTRAFKQWTGLSPREYCKYV
jgi:AraC-like DNA-binding protein